MKQFFIALAILFIASCNNQPQEETAVKSVEQKDTTAVAVSYTADMVVNKKDYSCGMPVSAGISDTCHYEGQAYGFCSPECKAEFLKDPKKAIAENK